MPNLASQIRVAFSSIAWNTGASSPGELEMNLQHVSGGGLLQQRFAQFVEQARVFDGDDGLRGEVLDQCDLLVTERPHFLAVDSDAPGQPFLTEHWNDEQSARTRQPD